MEDAGFKKIDLDMDSKSGSGVVPASTNTKTRAARETRASSAASKGAANEKTSQFSIKPMGKKKKFSKFNPRNMGILGVIIVILVIFALFTAFKTVVILTQAKKVYTEVKAASAAAKQENVIVAKDELVKTLGETQKLQKDLGGVSYLKFVPVLGGYVSDADHLTGAGVHGINAGIIAVDALIPYADVLGLKGQKSFAGGSAEDRIRTAIKTLDKVVPKIDDIDREVKLAKAEMDQVDVNHYPDFWVFKKARTQVSTAKNLVDAGVQAVDEGKPLIKVLPELLGATKSKKYLVLFQNDKELRPTGGFLTYYSIFRIEEGVIHIDSSNDIYTLDNSISSHPTADPIILKYLPKVSTQNIRDINLSPDFVKSMDGFRTYYAKSSLKTDIDGIIAIDTQFVVHLIQILGGVQADGQTFTANPDPACNCPQVVYQLEQNTTEIVNYVKTNRKGIVGDLLYATMQKALQSSPKLYWGPLFQAAIKDAEEKHVLFSLNNTDAQSGIEALNWAGRIKSTDGDYVHINDANFGGAKSNMYIKQSVQMEYAVASDGQIQKTVTITYINPQKFSDCSLTTQGGLCLNAILRNFQRLYVPAGSTLVSEVGSQVKVSTIQDLGKTAFESFFTVNPLGKATIAYTYKLPFKAANGNLPVLIQKQPGVADVPFVVNINGRQVDSFDLTADKILNLKI